MSTLSQPSARVKPVRKPVVRTVRIACGPSPDNPYFVVVITVGKKFDDYCVKPIASDFGAAYHVEKMFNPDDTVYHVNLSDDGAMTCDCRGHLAHGHCKHGEALLALRQAGKL
jgi:hypothetical protein